MTPGNYIDFGNPDTEDHPSRPDRYCGKHHMHLTAHEVCYKCDEELDELMNEVEQHKPNLHEKMKQKSQKQLQAEVDKFNENFPIGSKVKLKKDSGQIQEVTVESEASILGGHSAVGWFEEISGCYDLGRVIY